MTPTHEMAQTLRLLIVEDSEGDARLLLDELTRWGFGVFSERVQTADALVSALDLREWDLVIADYTMPGFSGVEALAIVRARDSDLPFIFISSTMGEDAAVAAMKAGAHDYIIKGALRRLAPAVERELREAKTRREHRHILAHARRLAHYDLLTDLPNRAFLHDRLAQELSNAQRTGRSLAFLMMDLDGFKEVNDTLGHRVGDRLLQQVGRRIQSPLRDVDTVARLGGDEFALLLPGLDGPGVVEMTRRILAAVQQPFYAEGLRLEVRASIGIGLYPTHGASPDLLMQRADVAMYAAKGAHSGFEVYSPEIDRYSATRLSLICDLALAVESNQLLVHYQPKIALSDATVLGFEVLTRWQHPSEGLLEPPRFMELAEQGGLMRPLTLAAIEAALESCRRWRTSHWKPLVAVNLSPRTLHDERFPDEVARLVRDSGLQGPCLEMEITENVIIANPARALATLSRLDQMGVRLSIDDFGTGYSSLSYLKTLPVREIKIDRSFITDLSRHGDETIVRSTIDLAHNLGLTALAEGVETGETWERLRALKCDAAQGYFVCPPAPFDEITEWVKRRKEAGASPAR